MVVLSFLLLVRNRVFCACGTQLKNPKISGKVRYLGNFELNLSSLHFKYQEPLIGGHASERNAFGNLTVIPLLASHGI
jgi:hypothetical protein